jgi:SRSO17 transposase
LFAAVLARIAPRFGRVEPRRRAATFLAGLVSDLATKNCWTLAEHAGDASPDRMQRLLATAVWDHDGVRDDLCGLVIEEFADPGAVLVVDETGDLKKGRHTVGVQRQYSGTAGRIENCQVAVFMAYVAARGHTFVDAELYLPASWTNDPDRCAAAGVPDGVEFATKPALARAMIARAVQANVPASWVAGDEVYGQDPQLRADRENAGLGYVLAVACDHRIALPRGQVRVDQLAARLRSRNWHRYSAGAGAKGHRVYDWAWIETSTDQPLTGRRWLLFRRNRSTGELAYYRCYAPRPVPLRVLVQVAGRRWPIEENFQTGKGQTGLDQHQLRRWISWRRWTILTMLAHALLAVTAARARDTEPASREEGEELIPYTLAEIRRLLNAWIINPTRRILHRLHWSRWRRQHQARAKRCHHHRHELTDTT